MLYQCRIDNEPHGCLMLLRNPITCTRDQIEIAAFSVAENFLNGYSMSIELAGSYCQVDVSGQCSGDYGVWSVAPTVRP